MSPAPFCAATFIQQNIEFFAAVGPVHNSLVDSPYEVQNRQAKQLILQQHARSPKQKRRYQRSLVLSLLQSNFVLTQGQQAKILLTSVSSEPACAPRLPS